MSLDPDKGYDVEVLGTCPTNTRPNSQHPATVECWHLWSYAQEASLNALSVQGTDCRYRLIGDAERRAKRIAANYADLYFKSAEKSQGEIQFYWVALAAFVVKDIAHAYEYTRDRVLSGAWRGSAGDTFGQDPYTHAMRTYLALAKGNLWLFLDIYPWLWFYLEYGINKDGSLNRARLDMCVPQRDSSSYQKQSKAMIEGLPYTRKWLDAAKAKQPGDAVYAEAQKLNDTWVKVGSTSNKAHRHVQAEIPKRNDMHDVPRSPYWKKFKEAYTVLEAMREETKRMADDGAASGRLEKVAKFTQTPKMQEALKEISRGKEGWPKSLQAELLAIAHHEQLNILQPLIYEDAKLKETLDMNHAYSRRAGWLAPPFQVVFSAAKDADDPELIVRFDPSVGALDWLSGSNKSLANTTDRMKFVGDIATRFNELMLKDKSYIEGELRKIRGWLDA